MKLQRLYSYVRQAVDDYRMIEENDRIAVGISGGKDSLTLLSALAGLQKFYPKTFSILAVTVDLGYEGFHFAEVERFCQKLQVEYHIVHTSIKDYVSAQNPNGSPCSLCSRLRKGAFNDAVKELGCNKIAYAHHMDDVIETMLLSMLYEGRFYSFQPVTCLERIGLTLIRPLLYVPEADVIGFSNKYHLPVTKNPCPFDGHTRREYVKQLLRQLNRDNPGVKKRMFSAISNGNIPGWDKPSPPHHDTLL